MAMRGVSRLVVGGVAVALVLAAADRSSVAGGGGYRNIPSVPVPAMPLPQIPAWPPDIEVPPPPAEAAPSPPVPAAPEPYGVHRNADGSWSLDPGCHWVDPDDPNDLRAVCD